MTISEGPGDARASIRTIRFLPWLLALLFMGALTFMPWATAHVYASAPGGEPGAGLLVTQETEGVHLEVMPLEGTDPSGEAEDTRDWPGIKRDTAYIFGYQALVFGVLYVVPRKVEGWTAREKRDNYDIDSWVDHVSHPKFDKDEWWVNYFIHPYWGAVLYVRARERGFNLLESALYSAFMSTAFEFGMEAFYEPPSYQDLIVTPLAGSFLGVYFDAIRDNIKAKGPDKKWYDKLALAITDPFGGVNKLIDRLLGIKSSVRLTRALQREGCLRAGAEGQNPGLTPHRAICLQSSPGVELTVQW